MDAEDSWHILFVKTGEEERVCTFLNQEKINCFIPKKEIMYRKNGQSEVLLQPMFPGHLFITSALPQRQFCTVIHQLRSRKRGIVRELFYDDEVTSALTPSEQNMLEQLLNQDKVLIASRGIIENDRVIILAGPLKGYESRIVHINRHKRQALLELNLCVRTVQVSVALEIIKKI